MINRFIKTKPSSLSPDSYFGKWKEIMVQTVVLPRRMATTRLLFYMICKMSFSPETFAPRLILTFLIWKRRFFVRPSVWSDGAMIHMQTHATVKTCDCLLVLVFPRAAEWTPAKVGARCNSARTRGAKSSRAWDPRPLSSYSFIRWRQSSVPAWAC